MLPPRLWLETSRASSSLPVVAVNPLCSLVCRGFSLVPASVISWGPSSWISPALLIRMLVGFGAHSPPAWPYLNKLHLQQPYFWIRSHSEVLGVRISTHLFLGGTQFNLQQVSQCFDFKSVKFWSSGSELHLLIFSLLPLCASTVLGAGDMEMGKTQSFSSRSTPCNGKDRLVALPARMWSATVERVLLNWKRAS